MPLPDLPLPTSPGPDRLLDVVATDLLGDLRDVVERYTGTDPVDGSTDMAVRYADRLTWSATPAQVDEIVQMGPARWLDDQLDPDVAEGNAALELTLMSFPTLTATGSAKRNASSGNDGQKELQLANLLRAAASTRQLRHVMAMFWHDHFNIGFLGGQLLWVAADYDRVIQAGALGRFDQLLRQVAGTAAMMLYLDNASSRGTTPNENYARELMELHTLGVDGGYSEDDVFQAALALTGWTTTGFGGADTELGWQFRPEWHHGGPVTVMDFSDGPRTGDGAVAQGEAFLSWLAHHPSTARHVCHKIAVRFCGDGDHTALVDRLVDTYLGSGTDIGAVIRTLVASDVFLHGPRTRLRRPFASLAATLRALRPTVDALGGAGSAAARDLPQIMAASGHAIHTWPAPDGFPDDAGHWSAAGSVLARWTAALAVVRNAVRGVTFDPSPFADAIADQTCAEAVVTLSGLLLARPLPQADVDVLVSYVTNDPSSAAADMPEPVLRNLCALICQTATGQHR